MELSTHLHPLGTPEVARVFDACDPLMRTRLLTLRRMIFECAQTCPAVGPLVETVRWGDAAYTTPFTKSGSLLRINRLSGSDTQYALRFHCKTDLVESFQSFFPYNFRYQGNRAIIFDVQDRVPVQATRFCIESALTYNLRKRSAAKVMASLLSRSRGSISAAVRG